MSEILYNNNDEPLVISKHLFDLILEQDDPSDLLALYLFYYYTAKWQKTDTPKVTNNYTANGLKWGITKVKKYRRILVELNLVKATQRKVNGTIVGHYLKINFIWSKVKVDKLNMVLPVNTGEIPSGSILAPVVETATNALSKNTNIKNALGINKEKLYKRQKSNSTNLFGDELKILPKEDKIRISNFEEFWRLYPKKTDKGKTLLKWEELCTQKSKQEKRPTWIQVKTAIELQIKTKRWRDGYIPLPATWLNQYRWLDDPNEMNGSWATKTPNNFNQKQTVQAGKYHSGTPLTYKQAIEV